MILKIMCKKWLLIPEIILLIIVAVVIVRGGVALRDLSPAAVGFLGGTLVPSPDVLFMSLQTDSGGMLTLNLPWPSGIPVGTSLWYQFLLLDAAAPQGVAASNGLRSTVR